MTSAIGSIVSLGFSLDVDDGWPPVAVECLPFRVEAEGQALLVPPVFVKGLSVGDVLAVTLEAGDRVESWRHIARSGRTTIWLLRMQSYEMIDAVLAELRAHGCDTTGLDELGVYAIDVPESVAIDAVDSVLARLDEDCVAVAFPSMRHEDQQP